MAATWTLKIARFSWPWSSWIYTGSKMDMVCTLVILIVWSWECLVHWMATESWMCTCYTFGLLHVSDVGEVVQTLRQWQSEGIMCDAILRGKSGELHPVHGCILAAVSPFLKSLLRDAGPGVLVIEPGLSGNEISQLLDGIYRGALYSGSANLKDLAQAGWVLGLNLHEAADSESEVLVMTDMKLQEDIPLPVPNLFKMEPHDKEMSENEARSMQGSESENSEEGAWIHKKPFKCKLCGKRFTRRDHLQEHLQTRKHSKEKLHIQCKYCDKSFKSRESAQRHRKLHENGQKSKCQFCGQMYRQPYLAVHERKHTGERPFSCEVCRKTFTCKYRCARHMATVHCSRDAKSPSKPQEKFACKQCDKTYTTKWHLKLHCTKHTGIMPFSCKHCGKQFARKYLWTEHEAKHTARSLKCSQCGDGFRTKVQLRTHIAGHKEDRPFNCHFCSLTFKREATLRSHLLTHSVKKKHRCPTCGQTFRSKQYMQGTHQWIHTGEKPLRSSYCDAMFSHPWMKALHDKKHQEARKKDGLLSSQEPDTTTKVVQSDCESLAAADTREPTCSLQRRLPSECEPVIGSSNHQPASSFRKYICSSCSQSFQTLSKLMCHKRLHVSIEPATTGQNCASNNVHQCKICQKSFRQKAQCNMHVKKVHPESYFLTSC